MSFHVPWTEHGNTALALEGWRHQTQRHLHGPYISTSPYKFNTTDLAPHQILHYANIALDVSVKVKIEFRKIGETACRLCASSRTITALEESSLLNVGQLCVYGDYGCK